MIFLRAAISAICSCFSTTVLSHLSSKPAPVTVVKARLCYSAASLACIAKWILGPCECSNCSASCRTIFAALHIITSMLLTQSKYYRILKLLPSIWISSFLLLISILKFTVLAISLARNIVLFILLISASLFSFLFNFQIWFAWLFTIRLKQPNK